MDESRAESASSNLRLRFMVNQDDQSALLSLRQDIMRRRHKLLALWRLIWKECADYKDALPLLEFLQQNFAPASEAHSVAVPVRFGAQLGENHLFFITHTQLPPQAIRNIPQP